MTPSPAENRSWCPHPHSSTHRGGRDRTAADVVIYGPGVIEALERRPRSSEQPTTDGRYCPHCCIAADREERRRSTTSIPRLTGTCAAIHVMRAVRSFQRTDHEVAPLLERDAVTTNNPSHRGLYAFIDRLRKVQHLGVANWAHSPEHVRHSVNRIDSATALIISPTTAPMRGRRGTQRCAVSTGAAKERTCGQLGVDPTLMC